MATRGPDPTVTDEEFEAVIEDRKKPFVTAKYVAERVGLSENRCRQRLQRLAEENRVKSDTIGDSQYTIYWSDGSDSSDDSS